jgi:hypothetical protein
MGRQADGGIGGRIGKARSEEFAGNQRVSGQEVAEAVSFVLPCARVRQSEKRPMFPRRSR